MVKKESWNGQDEGEKNDYDNNKERSRMMMKMVIDYAACGFNCM